MSNACRTLVGKLEGNRPRGRPIRRWEDNIKMVGKLEGNRPRGSLIRRWEDNIKMDLREIGWCGMDWINLTQSRDRWRALLNMIMTLRVT
jgi:hypothetical protein